MDVELLRWPAEEERRERLSRSRLPRLLLVASDEPPPAAPDCLEDWVRVPAAEAEVAARLAAVRARWASHGDASTGAALDGDGVLRVGDAWVALPPVEARLTAALLARHGAVVSREALARAGWPGGAPGRNALDVHVVRLRRRLAAVGLAIRTVRSRGYLLEAQPGGPPCSS
jgi:DNA-binding response OmpR family regulator